MENGTTISNGDIINILDALTFVSDRISSAVGLSVETGIIIVSQGEGIEFEVTCDMGPISRGGMIRFSKVYSRTEISSAKVEVIDMIITDITFGLCEEIDKVGRDEMGYHAE